MKSRPPAGGRSALALVVATNLLPLAGVVGFGWRVGELLAVYWIEVAALVIAHAAAAMFAERPIRLEDRSFYITGYDEDAERDEVWETDAEPVHLVSWLPPIYRRNFRVVRRSLGVFVFLLFPSLLAPLRPARVPHPRWDWAGMANLGIAHVVHRHPARTTIVFVVLVVLGILGSTKLTVENRFIDYFHEDT